MQLSGALKLVIRATPRHPLLGILPNNFPKSNSIKKLLCLEIKILSYRLYYIVFYTDLAPYGGDVAW
jgi:hypothetical protein